MSKNKELTHYEVAWYIDAWADNPTDAARQALAAQRRHGSIACVFSVRKKGTKKYTEIDLLNKEKHNGDKGEEKGKGKG